MGCGKYRGCISFRTFGSSYIDVNCQRDPLAMRSVSWYGTVRKKSEKVGFRLRYGSGFFYLDFHEIDAGPVRAGSTQGIYDGGLRIFPVSI
jgi:hypothetical protein